MWQSLVTIGQANAAKKRNKEDLNISSKTEWPVYRKGGHNKLV